MAVVKKYVLNDFKEAIISKEISNWIIHNCSMCNYPCGFVFNICDGDVSVGYDSGCDCISRPLQYRDLESVKNQFDIQTNQNVIKKYRKFFGFQ